MKKRIPTRLLSAFLAVVMVFLMIPISIVSVSAADTTKTMTPLQEYRANTTKSLEQITSYINKREAEDLALKNSFGNNIKKINTFSKGIGTAINTALMIYNTIDEDASWGENLGNIALNLVCSYIGVQLPGQESEAEVIIKEIEKMFDEVNSRIDAVNENINALSEQVDQNTANLASYMWSLNQFDNDIDVLNEFTQASNTGAYSYYTDREKLYASYNELMLLLDSGTATSSAIKSAYDKLYIEAIKSEQLYQYMTGENNKLTNGKSIQEALYEYSVLSIYLCSKGEVADENGNLENIEIKCVEFAEDLYSTYMFSNYALMLCYNYQIDYLNSHSNDALTTYYDVEGIEGVNNILGASIFGHENLAGKIPSMLEKQEIINIEIASYIAYVLNLEGSFLYENGANAEENTVYSIPYKELFATESHNTDPYQITYGNFAPVTKHVRTNNKVSTGDILYMNVLPNDLASLFASGEFTFVTSDENLATVNNAGVVNIVGTSGNFMISMKYNGVIIYSLEFTIEDRLYSGGMGIEDCPYFVSTWNDITALAASTNHYQAENIYFKTTRDIDGSGATFAGIPSFKGTWNGNEYRVYNFKIDTSGINNTGFFRVVESSATIKNVILGHYDKSYSTYDNYSVYVNGYLDCDGVFYVGGLCGANYGTISNCSLEAVKVCGKIYWAGDNDISNVVGGIAGRNEKDIDNCKVSKSFFYSNATAKKDGDASLCHAYTGGIVGKNIGVLKDSISYSNHMAGYTYSKQDWGDAPGAYTYCGAMMGWMTQSGTADNCYEQQNTFDPVADADDSSNDDTATGGISGYRDMTFSGSIFDMNIVYLGTVTNCGENSLGSWTISSTTGCPTKLVLIQDSDPIVGGGTYADVLEYVRGDKCLKYTYTTGGNPAYATTTTYEYELSIGRIDTSKAGTQPAVKLTTISGTTQYHKETLTITVVPEEITKLEIYTAPSKQIYAVNSESLDLSGLRLVVLYNNGSTRFLNNGNEEGLPKDFTEAYDFTALGETSITFKYDEFDVSVPVTVVYCTHSNTESKGEIEPTCDSVGYEAGIYCNDCQGYIEGGAQIPMTGNHIYSEWSKYNDDQHTRICECGETEYADHDWNDGVVTTEPTHLASGEKTYTCTECTATKTEDIPPIEGHTFGKWTKHNDAQHVRSCECGETEYADHNWDDGTITTPATYEKEGVRTYECLDCEATYTVVIPIPVSIHLFVVDDASAVPGGTMRVNVRLENNPGIAMMRLKISYDSSVLDLEQVNYNTEIGGTATQPTIYDGYVTLLWYNDSENVEGDWIFATLTFTVKDTAPVGSVSDIVLTYDAEEVCDIEENNVVFSIDNGSATVLDHVPGDINGDDGLTSKDLLRLARYFAGWEVEVNENALDINGDGNVNSKDLLRLARYLAGWDVEIH